MLLGGEKKTLATKQNLVQRPFCIRLDMFFFFLMNRKLGKTEPHKFSNLDVLRGVGEMRRKH